MLASFFRWGVEHESSNLNRLAERNVVFAVVSRVVEGGMGRANSSVLGVVPTLEEQSFLRSHFGHIVPLMALRAFDGKRFTLRLVAGFSLGGIDQAGRDEVLLNVKGEEVGHSERGIENRSSQRTPYVDQLSSAW